MKARTILLEIMFLPLLCTVATPARAQVGNADFQRAVQDYQGSLVGLDEAAADAAAEKVIRMAATMNDLPPIPEEARKHFLHGTLIFKNAKTILDYNGAVFEFGQAIFYAPWWPEARYNRALAWEAMGKYSHAIQNFKLYLLFKLPETEARTVQDRIFTPLKPRRKKRPGTLGRRLIRTEEKNYEDENIAFWTYASFAVLRHRHSGQEQTANAQQTFNQYVADLQSNPNDTALRGKIIALAQTMRPAPAIPEEARGHYVMATTFAEKAKSDTERARDSSDLKMASAGFERAVAEYKAALLAASRGGPMRIRSRPSRRRLPGSMTMPSPA